MGKCRQMIEKIRTKGSKNYMCKNVDKKCRQKADKKVDTIIGHKNSKNYENGQKLEKR